MLLSKYSSGLRTDSPTALSAAKCITQSKRVSRISDSRAARSRTSSRWVETGMPASFAMRRGTSTLLLLKLSAMTASCPRSANTTQAWLPM